MDEFQDRLRDLTPRQRDAWERAGFPGIRDRDPEKLRPFLEPTNPRAPTLSGFYQFVYSTWKA